MLDYWEEIPTGCFQVLQHSIWMGSLRNTLASAVLGAVTGHSMLGLLPAHLLHQGQVVLMRPDRL